MGREKNNATGSALFIYLSVASVGLLATPTQVQAQAVVPDGPLKTIVTQSGNTFTITNGTAAGTNLFHSFREFSIPTEGTATFDLSNTPNTTTIFSRITGGIPSNIDGLIQTINASTPVSLFLLNPNGIVFGANARLNIGGSFIGTTAQTIQFADGTRLSATDPAPLLTLSIPIGLQMGPTSRAIAVEGTGNNEFFPAQNLGLVGSPGATLALLGNGVSFRGGVVTVPAGRLEVGSIAHGDVRLNPTPIGTWQLDYSSIPTFADIELAGQAWLWNPYPVANPFGGLQVVGRNITLDRAQISAATPGTQPGGDVQIRAQDTLTLQGITPGAPFPSSRISNQVLPGATGAGGNITIQAGRVVAREGSPIETVTFDAGKAGTVTVNADAVRLTDEVAFFSSLLGPSLSGSSLASRTYGSGDVGDIFVNARQIEMLGGGSIITTTAPGTTGRGGNIHLKSDQITATGATAQGSSSGIQAVVAGFGKGGNVTIETGTLSLVEGASALTFAYRIPGIPYSGFGDAGDLQVSARDRIELANYSLFFPSQSSFLGSVTTGSGQGGNATIRTPVLSIRNGASVSAGTAAVIAIYGDPKQSTRLGNGGNLTVSVGELELSGVNSLINNGSGLGTFTFGNGDAGHATITADRIRISDGANIVASTFSTGSSGELKIRAREIAIAGQQAGRNAAILASADQLDPSTRAIYGLPEVPTGRTARLTIVADQITLSDRGKISTTHQGTGNASALEISSNRIVLNQNAAITATTRTGNGGDINLRVQDLLVLRNNSRISAASAGDGNGGNIALNSGLIVGVDNSDIIANAVFGNGGNINLTTQGLIGISPRSQLTPASDITASSRFGMSGTVQVNTINVDPNAGLIQLSDAVVDSSQQIAAGCAAHSSDQFIVTGRGGILKDPKEDLIRDRPWKDLRSLPDTSQAKPVESTPTLVEATKWKRDANGKIQLIAAESIQPTLSSSCAE